MMFGRSSLFHFKYGEHSCVFYRSEDRLMDVLSTYVAEGLLHGERCFCTQKPHILKRLRRDLRTLGFEPDREIKRGALELHTVEEKYFPNGRFEPKKVVDRLATSVEKARAEGFAAFRTVGELSWLTEKRNHYNRLLEYEKLLEEYFPGKPAIGLCQYSVDRFPTEILDSALKDHCKQIDETAEKSRFCSVTIRGAAETTEIVADKMAVNPRYYFVMQGRGRRGKIFGWGAENNYAATQAKIDELTQKRKSAKR
jgi:hypothetical protein